MKPYFELNFLLTKLKGLLSLFPVPHTLICTYLGGKDGLNTISSKHQPSAPQLRCTQEPIGTIAELRPPVMIRPLPYWRAQCECLPSGRATGNCKKTEISSSNDRHSQKTNSKKLYSLPSLVSIPGCSICNNLCMLTYFLCTLQSQQHLQFLINNSQKNIMHT